MIDPQKIGDLTYKKAESDNHIEMSKDMKSSLKTSEKQTENDHEFEINKSNSLKDLEKNNNDSIILDSGLNTYMKESNLKKIRDLKNSEMYKTYRFNKQELEKVKIDITFAEINSKSNSFTKDQTQMAVEFTKNNNKKYPEIGYIIKIVKRLLQIENLNNSFNGKHKKCLHLIKKLI